jgi:hypothetical protein
MGNTNDKPALLRKATSAAQVTNGKLNDYEEKYQINFDKDKIGGGTYGTVFRITRKSDGKVLAMKVSQSSKNNLSKKNSF